VALGQDSSPSISPPPLRAQYYYLADCTMFSIFLRPFDNYSIFFLQLPLVIPVFFHQSLFAHQSSYPFHPGNFRSTSFSSSWWTLLRHFFWQSSLFHSLNMSVPLNLFCLILSKRDLVTFIFCLIIVFLILSFLEILTERRRTQYHSTSSPYSLSVTDDVSVIYPFHA